MINYINRSSSTELIELAKKLNIPNFHICVKDELPKVLKNKKIQNIIINLDSFGNGSHWCAVSVPHKIYFDSYAQDKPMVIPYNYKLASTKKELQSIDSSMCGQLSCLFLYYINFKSKEQFYDKFKDVYK